MKEQFDQLLHLILKRGVSDVHLTLQHKKVKTTIRSLDGLEELHCSAIDESLFNYLKYVSHLDLGHGGEAQNGNFTYVFQGRQLDFRFSLLSTLEKQTAVLRILNNHQTILLEDLSYQKKHLQSFLRWTKTKSGLVLLSGPTGSGKTTTLHAILHKIAKDEQLRVVSLEDPIEIQDDSYLQLQINENNHFSYEEGIRQLLRHDPDVIMIGEIRDPNTARMMLRCALSGHMVFTTTHAKSCVDTIHRLLEFGLNKEDLHHSLSAVCAQRLYTAKNKKGRICIYEILENEDLQFYFKNDRLPQDYKDIKKEIQTAVQQGLISSKEASYDINDAFG